MNYDSFLDKAKTEAENRFPGIEAETNQVDKLQGESYKGLLVRFKGSDVGVTMNLTSAFEMAQKRPNSLGAILNDVMAEIKKALRDIPRIDPSHFMNYAAAKNKLVMQVIPAKQNEEMLNKVPHKTIEDIAVVYRIELGDDERHGLSTLVTNEMLNDFGVTRETLHRDAVRSQMKICPPTLKNLSEELSFGGLALPESPLWVASVEGSIHGAAATQLPDFLDMAAEKLGGDFYILPSSIHECLFIPDDGNYDLSDLEKMVQSVNKMEVSESDFLSDSVYHYDCLERVFEKARTFEARMVEQEDSFLAMGEQGVMEVLLVEPDKPPQQVTIGNRLGDLQNAVGGVIEAVYPFDDPVALIVNEEGKLNGLPLNRALRDEEGNVVDIVAGSFLVAGLTEDSFGSLTKEQMAAYEEKFHDPEVFIRMGKDIAAIPVPCEIMEQKTGLSIPKQHIARGEESR